MFPYPPFFTPRYRYPYPPSGFSPSRNKQPSKQNTTSSSKKYAENKKQGNNSLFFYTLKKLNKTK